MADLKQILLNANGCSGRGVRLRTLAIDEVMKLREGVAQEVGAEATVMEFNTRLAISSVASTVAQVTEATGIKAAKDLVGVAWKKVTRQELETDAAKHFTTADMDALVKIFQKTHSVTEKEIENILGEAQTVTED